MANVKITELTALATAALTDVVAVVDLATTTTKKMTLTVMRAALMPIVNADVSASAAIAVSKLAPGTNTNVLTTTGGVAVWAAPTGFTAPTGTGLMTVTAGAMDAASAAMGAGFLTFVATPSGANLASLLTSALPVSKGGTGVTALTGFTSLIDSTSRIGCRGLFTDEVVVATTGTINDYAVGDYGQIYFNGGAAVTLNGIAAPAAGEARDLILLGEDDNGTTITPANEAAGSVAENRISIPAASVAAAYGWHLRYSPQKQRWCVIGYPAY